MLGNGSRVPFGSRATKTPPPFTFTKVGPAQGSPYSYNGRTSRDGLMASPTLQESPPDEAPPPPPHQTKIINSNDYLSPGPRPVLERSASAESFARSGAQEDTDAQMVRESFRTHQANSESPTSVVYSGGARGRLDMHKQGTTAVYQKVAASATSSSVNSINTPSLSSNSSHENGQNTTKATQATPTNRTARGNASPSNSTTPRITQAVPIAEEEDEPLFGHADSSKADALLALNLSESRNTSDRSNEPKKVYTAAQFRILKKHEMSNNTTDEDGVTSDDGYDDDEEDEVTRAQKQRLQEHKDAQHKIWRQRMTKAIGDQSTNIPGRSSMQLPNQSMPNLAFSSHSPKASISEAGGGSGGSSDDEDVPLAVLQAHGFPSKSKPPDARHSANSFVGISRPMSGIGNLPRPGSPGGARSVAGGPRGSLPPFARKLPQDPYLGASDLVSPANRESLGFNSQRPPSVYTPAGAPPPANIPNGLVGVIAEEERQRSMRRGSPNQPGLRQSTYMPAMTPQIGGGMGMPMMGMPAPGMMPMAGIAPGSEQQQQLNQQMFQLLQQQTVMIQQLMSQGGLQGMQQPNPFSNVPTNPQNRPMSMASGNVRPMGARTMSMVNLAPPTQARTMSMINIQPNMGPAFNMDTVLPSGASVRGLGLHGNGHYAPSVAPSERSNVGQPSRYKPVQSSIFADGGSTITATSTIQASNPEKKKGFLSAVIHPSNKSRGKENAPDDEDDDWSNFAAKRRGQA